MKKTLLLFALFFLSIVYCSAQNSPLSDDQEISSIRINCNGSVQSPNPPLFILQYKQSEIILDSARLNQIEPEDIQEIHVMKKEADTIEKYGEKARNGVVIIQLKEPIDELLLKEKQGTP